MRVLRNIALAGAVAAIGLAASTAQADVSIFLGNTPGGNNVLFNNNPPDGFSVTGVLNQGPSTFNVNFTSTQELHGNGGQARLEPVNDPTLNNVTIALDSGFGFLQYVGNPFSATRNSIMHIVVNAFDKHLNPEQFTADLAAGNGQNFFTVQAANGEMIKDISISGTNWQDLRQNRISGAGPIQREVVPEGNSMMMLCGGGLPFIGLLAMRRRRQPKA